jgi:hypothetical protein
MGILPSFEAWRSMMGGAAISRMDVIMGCAPPIIFGIEGFWGWACEAIHLRRSACRRREGARKSV